MPRKRNATEPAMAPVPSEILNHFAPDRILSAAEVEAAAKRFNKALIERALGAELTHHLGYAPGAIKPDDVVNHRNGTSDKTVLTDDGPVDIEVPATVGARSSRS
jgi:putative transposase